MIIGTAGHIDHGKSALVRALTGRAMDRLAEERRRGITIDLNFAPLVLEGLPPIGIVDVPGHEDFVRTMVAGATGIDLVLLVVDAAEGVRPQTREHLAVVEQLRVPRGIPVLAKADLVEAAWLDLVAAELAEQLEDSPVAFATPVATSAVTGLGLELLRAAIREEAGRIAPRDPDDLFRMPVDRVFALAGVGTVVTGTVWAGSVRVGDQVRLVPDGPEGRIRSLESFGTGTEVAEPGARAAIGLTGVDREQVRRGQLVVAAGDPWQSTTAFDAVITLGHSAPAALRARHRVRLHHGTGEVMARVHPREPIEPGRSGRARLALEQPVVLRGGDRFVLRQYSPVTTVGGGRGVAPLTPPRARGAAGGGGAPPARRLEALVTRRPGGVPAGMVPVLLGVAPSEVESVAGMVDRAVCRSGRWVDQSRIGLVVETMRRMVTGHHEEHPASPGLSLETLRSALGAFHWLVDDLLREPGRSGLTVAAGHVTREGFVPRPGGGEEEVDAVVAALDAAGLEPPRVDELAAGLRLVDLQGALRIAAGRGLVEQVERDRWYSRNALERFRVALETAGVGGKEISPGTVRDSVGLSRKFLIPLLEWADRTGITLRNHRGIRTLK